MTKFSDESLIPLINPYTFNGHYLVLFFGKGGNSNFYVPLSYRNNFKSLLNLDTFSPVRYSWHWYLLGVTLCPSLTPTPIYILGEKSLKKEMEKVGRFEDDHGGLIFTLGLIFGPLLKVINKIFSTRKVLVSRLVLSHLLPRRLLFYPCLSLIHSVEVFHFVEKRTRVDPKFG